MPILFWICVLGEIVILLPYFWSLEHLRLQGRFGKEKGIKIGDILGMISGWGFFLFWIGIWVAPQPEFTLLMFQDQTFTVPLVNFSIPLIHLLIFIPLIIIAMWIALKGVKDVSLKVAETHRAEKVITTGSYSIVRHPQYLGGLLAHIAISFFLSALYSLIATPFMVIIILLISWKEEKELIKEFSTDYEDYMKKVPMLFPKLKFRI
ncbi:MAG: methyltransferase family protein [Candidatus Hodarchaeales archaeon]|jgi:protein-S-isoprenylcysteine O-methyltransferase Ste14